MELQTNFGMRGYDLIQKHMKIQGAPPCRRADVWVWPLGGAVVMNMKENGSFDLNPELLSDTKSVMKKKVRKQSRNTIFFTSLSESIIFICILVNLIWHFFCFYTVFLCESFLDIMRSLVQKWTKLNFWISLQKPAITKQNKHVYIYTVINVKQ